jgi:DNA-binding response OmpR family regulator
MTDSNSQQPAETGKGVEKKSILHLCKRELLRPLRDQILRLSGYEVNSTCESDEAIEMFKKRPYDLVVIDVEGETGVHDAERLCAEIKTIHHGQHVAFVCNWRVAILSDCPDEILRTEFDPAAFVKGVREALEPAKN